MAHAAVIAAVEARLVAKWSALPVRPLNDTDGSSGPSNSPFVEVQYPMATSVRWAMGDRTYRETGGVRFVINGIKGTGGIDTLATWAGQLGDLFRDVRLPTMTGEPVTFQSPGTPMFGDSNDNGSYFVAAFVVPYYFTFTSAIPGGDNADYQ